MNPEVDHTWQQAMDAEEILDIMGHDKPDRPNMDDRALCKYNMSFSGTLHFDSTHSTTDEGSSTNQALRTSRF